LKQGFDNHWRLREEPTETHWINQIDVDLELKNALL